MGLLEQTLVNQAIGIDEAKGLLRVITYYAYALTTLDRFDHGTLSIEQTTQPTSYVMGYETAMEIVDAMKSEFGGLFGLEKDQGFRGALGAIYQTFEGKELYPSIEEKVANLLYFVVKDHAFSDGNKRIGAASIIGSSLGGIRVSTTHTITGGIIGVGSLRRLSAVKWGVAGNIVVAWDLTLPGSALISALGYLALKAFGVS